MGHDEGVPVSISSIVRRLLTALAVCGPLGATLWFAGLHEAATPFVLATAIDLGLITVAVTWRGARARPPRPALIRLAPAAPAPR